ncbi:MAG: ABC transporter permease [Actinomycetota bacterium]|nr:ABC transporter permease [Actinomycetota bacterium]
MTAVVTSGKRRSTAVWATFALPGVAWLVAFFLVSVYAVMAVAFGSVDPLLRTTVPQWNPLQWDYAAMRNVLDRVFGGDLGHVFVRTGAFVGSALLGCIVVGYPVAYFVARKAHRHRGLLLVALVLPFWISYLMRMLAWANLLQPDGYVNRILSWLPFFDTHRTWLDGDWYTVVIGLVYGYVPFFILPLYATLERIDGRLIEAGRDLGASSFSTFVHVTLPLSIPGLMAASVITILPMCGDYYTNTYLSRGSPRTEMVGNQIDYFLRNSSQPQTGASLVLLLMAFLFVLMVYYLVITVRQQRAAER